MTYFQSPFKTEMPRIFIYISCISDKSTMLVRTGLGNGIKLSGLAPLETENLGCPAESVVAFHLLCWPVEKD